MNEKSFNTLKNEYIFFKNRLDENIRNCQITRNLQPSDDCYLIEESYIKQIEESFIDYNSPNTPKNTYRTFSGSFIPLPLKEPKIINDFKTALNYIDNNKKFALISRRIIQMIDTKNKLIDNNCVVYYGGNRKLIIEFKDVNEKKSLLLVNPLSKKSSKKNIFIILSNQQKILYLDILSDEDNSNIETMSKQNSYIVSYENYVTNNYRPLSFYQNFMNSYSYPISNLKYNVSTNFTKINPHNNISTPISNDNTSLYSQHTKLYTSDISGIYSNNTYAHAISKKNRVIINFQDESPFKKELLKIFIYIFFYEKSLSENKENFFSDKKKYCLINPQWLTDFKEFYNYEKLSNLLNKNSKDISNVNYNNIDEAIDEIIKLYSSKNTLNFNKKQLSEELTDIKNITCFLLNKFGIKFILEGVIMPVKIMKLIKDWNKKIPIFPKELYFKKKFIIYVNNQKIIIGNLNEDNLFTPIYVFEYNSSNIVPKERKIILNSKTIKEYIKLRKCSEYNFKLQNLKDEKDVEIGKLIIMKSPNKSISKNKRAYKLKILTQSEISNLRANTIENAPHTKPKFSENKIKQENNRAEAEENKKIQININTNIFSKLPKSKLIKVIPSLHSSRAFNTRHQNNLVNKNQTLNQTTFRVKKKGNNNEEMKALIKRLMKNNLDLQKKLENKVSEVNKKNEMIEKLKTENEKLVKRGLSNDANKNEDKKESSTKI